MGRRIGLTGEKFGRLTVIGEAEPQTTNRGDRRRLYECKCSCGTLKTVRMERLRSGGATSCGCLSREKQVERQLSHGLSKHPLFFTWWGMMQRCSNPIANGYHNYGGRGIEVCASWHEVGKFIADVERLLGDRPEGMTLDRVDNDGNYEEGNVRWASGKEQSLNSRAAVNLTAWGETKPLVVWADEQGLSQGLIHNRLRLGWSTEKALSEAVKGAALIGVEGQDAKPSSYWADECGISRKTFKSRLALGWSLEDAMKTPVRRLTRAHSAQVNT